MGDVMWMCVVDHKPAARGVAMAMCYSTYCVHTGYI